MYGDEDEAKGWIQYSISLWSLGLLFVFSEPLVPADDDWEVTWSSFCKDSLPGRNFSFWDWFFAAKRLVRDHLRDVWNAG